MKGQEQSFSSPSPTGTWSISPAHSISWPVWRHWAPQHHPKGAGHGPGGALSSPEALVRTGQCWQQVSIPISSSTFQLPKQTGPGSSTNTGGELGLEGATPRDARALTAPPQHRTLPTGHIFTSRLGRKNELQLPRRTWVLTQLGSCIPEHTVQFHRGRGGRAQLTPTEQFSSLCPRESRDGICVCRSFILSSYDPVQAAFRKTILYTF